MAEKEKNVKTLLKMLKMLNSILEFFLNFKYIFAPVERWAGPGRQAGWGQNNLH